jgi:TRAP-type C4-dicarboxylate transport system substrate-binding protein
MDDFKGMKMRVNPLYIPFMKALGVAPVSSPATEIYTLLERKVVEGTMWPTHGMIPFGFHKLLKYAIEPGVFQIDTSVHMNLEKWNKLPKDCQELLMDVMQDMEWIGSMRGMLRTEEEGQVMWNAGMKRIYLPPGEAEKFQKIAYEKTWEYLIGISPEYGPKLKQLTSKSAVPKGTLPWRVQ